MPVRDLLAEAKARGIPTKGLLEKSEFIEALVAASAPAPVAASFSSNSSRSAAGLDSRALETPMPARGTSAQSAFVHEVSPPPHAHAAMSESQPIQFEFEHSWLRALSASWGRKLDPECRQVLTTFGCLSFWQERFELYKLAAEAKARPNSSNYKGERFYNSFFADLTNHAGSRFRRRRAFIQHFSCHIAWQTSARQCHDQAHGS